MGIVPIEKQEQCVLTNVEPNLKLESQETFKLVQQIKDKYELLPSFLKARGLVRQHIDSFNYFIKDDLQKIVFAKGNVKVTCDADPSFYLKYTNIYVGEPSYEEDYITKALTPQGCRLRDITYSAPLFVDIEYTLGKNVIEKKKPGQGFQKIGMIPIMLRSNKCRLYKKNEAELAKLGECPLDPGGYFIVKGNEKVILIQEQLSKNRVITERDSKGNIRASVMSSTHEMKTQTTLIKLKDKFYLRHNSFIEDINIQVLLRAMGVESDQEFVTLVHSNEELADQLIFTIEECKKLKVFNQQQAIDYLQTKIKFRMNQFAGYQAQNQAKNNRSDEVFNVLSNYIYCHIPCVKFHFQSKVVFIGYILRRMMYAQLDSQYIDDRDYYGNKRLELAGSQLALLFEDCFKQMNDEIRKMAYQHLSKQKVTSQFDVSKHIRSDIITYRMENACSTGNWHIGRFRMDRKGVTQVLNRLSFISCLGMMTKMQSHFEKTRKVSGPRALQPSQWGMVCPADTPEGESCGLVKNLALMTHVTTDQEEGPIAGLAYLLGVQPANTLNFEAFYQMGCAQVILNGFLLGVHGQPQKFVQQFRELRRTGHIGQFVGICLQQDLIQIACDGGRVCRPLIICNRGQPRVKHSHIEKLKGKQMQFQDFLNQGLIEYLDVNEENNSLIAMYEKDLRADHTHLEIEPLTILGIVAGLIPYPHHNQSPRNTYQCAMGKQAMGNVAFNQLNRMDTLLYLLVYPQKPLVTTKTIELVGYDQLGAGINTILAVTSYSGYDIEDASIQNRASLDRGFMRCIVLRKYGTSIKKYANRAADIVCPPAKKLNGQIREDHRLLDNDGIASPGLQLNPGDVYVNKQVPLNTKEQVNSQAGNTYKPAFTTWKGIAGQKTIVDKVALTQAEERGSVSLKMMVRHLRRPEIGDKFSSRHGQKGVCGLIVKQEDLPFSELGISPDMVMNPHGFPSRMTVGKLLELVGSKAAVLTGKFHYGTAFGEPSGLADKVEDIYATLSKLGYNNCGKDFLISGTSGEPLEASIFMGPVYYQRLKHMVLDKMHARAQGPRLVLTRQPTEGRSRDGGLRLGEMERDCLISYGASMLLQERLMISSDACEVYVDSQSGLMGYFDSKSNCALSPIDGSSDRMVKVQMPYACKLLLQELQSMNILPRLGLKEA